MEKSKNALFADLIKKVADLRNGISPLQRSHLEHVRKAIEDQSSEELANIRNLIDNNPTEFARLICEAVLGVSREGIANPFAQTHDGKATCDLSPFVTRPPMARAMLDKIEGKSSGLNSEYISLSQLILERWRVEPYFFSPRFTQTTIHVLIDEFYESFAEDLGFAIFSVCDDLRLGLPLYAKSSSADIYEQVEYLDEGYVYLRQRAALENITKAVSMPGWASKFYVRTDHLKTHDLFFSGFEGTADEAEILKTAFRRQIGVDVRSTPITETSPRTRKHTTKLLALVNTVIERYYGTNFDPLNKDTWPSQETIKSWLRLEFGLSDREATSIDIVARPDNIRGK